LFKNYSKHLGTGVSFLSFPRKRESRKSLSEPGFPIKSGMTICFYMATKEMAGSGNIRGEKRREERLILLKCSG